MGPTNEWGRLKKVIVGISDEAKVPEIDLSVRTINYADKTDTSDVIVGNYPQKVVEESSEDLEIFVKFLKEQGVEVLRPEKNNPKYFIIRFGYRNLSKIKYYNRKNWFN